MDYKYNMCLGLGLYIFVRGFGAACKRRGLISERAHEKRFEARDSSADQIAFRNPFYTFGEELISGGAYNGIYFFLTVEWAYLPRSSGWRENLGKRLWAYNWEGGGGGVRYFANSLHAGAAMMGSKTSSRFSSFCSTPAPVSGQSSLEIVGWPKSLSFFFTKDCLML